MEMPFYLFLIPFFDDNEFDDNLVWRRQTMLAVIARGPKSQRTCPAALSRLAQRW